MSLNVALALLMMAAAGVALAVQAPLNAGLSRSLGSPFGAAALSFGVGFALLLAVALAIGDGANLMRLAQTPPVLLLGGFLGAFYVVSTVLSVPLLGVLTTTGMLILGQMAGALLLDHIGAFGAPLRELSPLRLLAAAMVAGGVILSRW